MTGRRHVFLWVLLGAAIVVAGGIHAWVLYDQANFSGVFSIRYDAGGWVLFTVFMIIPWLLNPTPLLGLWFLARARRDGGGRWAWRWWAGGFLVWGFVADVIDLPRYYQPNVLNFASHPVPELLSTLIAAGPVWIFASRRRTA